MWSDRLSDIRRSAALDSLLVHSGSAGTARAPPACVDRWLALSLTAQPPCSPPGLPHQEGLLIQLEDAEAQAGACSPAYNAATRRVPNHQSRARLNRVPGLRSAAAASWTTSGPAWWAKELVPWLGRRQVRHPSTAMASDGSAATWAHVLTRCGQGRQRASVLPARRSPLPMPSTETHTRGGPLTLLLLSVQVGPS